MADLRRDAHCEVRPQSFIGEYFVDCQPGTSPRAAAGRRDACRSSRPRSTIRLDLVNNILRRPYRERLRLIVGELGAGLAGRPGRPQRRAPARPPRAARDEPDAARSSARQTRTIKRFIADADTVVGALERRKTDVARFVREAGGTAEMAATRRDELAAQRSTACRPSSASCEPYMAQLGDLADGADAGAARPRAAASGDLDTFLTRLGPFAAGGAPGVPGARRAPRSSAAGRSGEHREELERAAPAGAGRARAGQAAAPVPPDDSTTASARSSRTRARPRPSRPRPTRPHIADGSGGFTGMEALWNYFYWQALVHQRARRHRAHAAAHDRRPRSRAGQLRELEARARNQIGPYQPGQPIARSHRKPGSVPTPAPTRRGGRRPRSDRSAARPPRPAAAARRALDGQLRTPAHHGLTAAHGRGPAPRLPARRHESGAATAIVASPVLVGAVTVLVAIVAVFLAYNANQGLPFVPTYELNAELPNGAKLVEGNEVRAGGFRVGVGRRASPATPTRSTGKERSIALLDLKLDKHGRAAGGGHQVGVRPRSALGLKYVELLPGTSDADVRGRRHDAAAQRDADAARARGRARRRFQPETRADARQALLGLRRRARRPRRGDQRGDRASCGRSSCT